MTDDPEGFEPSARFGTPIPSFLDIPIEELPEAVTKWRRSLVQKTQHLISFPSAPDDFQPVPLEEFVIKIYERCNLACNYCYMYEMADQTWQQMPTTMSDATFSAVSYRIAEHARTHVLDEVRVVFHGGEPLLRGKRFLAAAADRLRRDVDPRTSILFRVQTNATLLDKETLTVLDEYDIAVGVSLDGDRTANDRHRAARNGASSYEKVIEGLTRLREPRFRRLFRHLYCTIDLENDPIDTYMHLLAFDPPMIDFFLPHGNWESPPAQRKSDSNDNPYADWLIPIFDDWYNEPGATRIRYFDNILAGLLGGVSTGENVGLGAVNFVCVDTDGSISQVDTLKSAYEGAATTDLNVFSNSLDEAMVHPAIVARQIGLAGLGTTCRQCDIVTTCGGGNYPHRYNRMDGFMNPSVYCRDLYALIRHMQKVVESDLAARTKSVGVQPSRHL